VYSSTAASPAGPAPSSRGKREFYPASDAKVRDKRTERSVRALTERKAAPARSVAPERSVTAERGLKWWVALLILIGIAVAGALIDSVFSIQGKDGFNIGIVVASIVAIILVKRSHMFPVVIAPPIVYSAGALFQLYVRSSGLNDRRVVLDAAANYLVYGFPAIAAATAAVLIIAGFRLITRK
jgi:hypothetical protein